MENVTDVAFRVQIHSQKECSVINAPFIEFPARLQKASEFTIVVQSPFIWQF